MGSMRLTKHQEEIVKKIVSEEVYDVPSYLKAFNKGRIVKYNTSDLKQKFYETEQDATYKVIKEGHSLYTYHSTKDVGLVLFPRTRESITDDEWEYRPARLEEDISPYQETYNEQTFTFDFQNNGVFVADKFESVRDFISLWSYLKREALVLEVEKTIEARDIGIYYQLKPIIPEENNKKIQWHMSRDSITTGGLSSIVSMFEHGILDKAPVRNISDYLESTWQIDKDHLLICKEFLGKKILPNSDLNIYVANKFKTTTEIAQHHSLSMARIAIALSIIAILIGNILPLFQASNEELLNDTNRNLVEISEKLNSFQPILSDNEYYIEISNYLDEIYNSLLAMQSRDNTKQLNDLLTRIEDIHTILLERLPME